MSGILQKFGFRKSPYLRPNQQWVCGNEKTGHACPTGPDHRGRCLGGAECQPGRQGDRWKCTRSSYSGGPCKEGPLPDGSCCRPITKCLPSRSIAAKRGVLAVWVASFTLALVLIGFSLAGGMWAANPGKLTNQHTQAGGCESCHSTYEHGVRGWIQTAFNTSTASEDSERCITCHELGESPGMAHGVSTEDIQKLTDSGQASKGSKPLIMNIGEQLFGPSELEEIACMSCHREHKGTAFDLTEVANQTCINCHTNKFKQFSGDHPGFTDYPYQSRTRIAFDHVSHIGKYFEEDDFLDYAPTGCNSCHTPDSVGQTMQAGGFDQSCSACHLGQIVGKGRASAKGIFVFGVPGLDRETFYERGILLGEWPEYSEEPISPFVELMLSSDEDFVTAYNAVKQLEFLDISDAPDETLEQIAQVAWAFKELIYDLIQEGAEGLRERLSHSIEQPLDDQIMAELIAMLPMDLMLSAQRSWFPDLFDEVNRYRQGEELVNPSIDDEFDQTEPEQSLLESSEENDVDSDGDDQINIDDLLSGTENDDQPLEADADMLAGDIEDQQIDIDDLFEENSDIDGLLGDDSGIDALLAGDDDNTLDLDGLLDEPIDVSQASSGTIEVSELTNDLDVPALEEAALSHEAWMKYGGWYQDDLALRYRPTGHSDKFILSWLEIGSHSDGGLAQQIFEDLSAEQAPGGCVRCHSIDKQEGSDNVYNINWKGKRPDPLSHNFTRFSHTAHFSLLDQKGCSKCHQFNTKSDFMSSFEDRNQMSFSSNFNPIEKSVCEACHQQGKAGEDCSSCHLYHTGSFKPTLPFQSGMSMEPVE